LEFSAAYIIKAAMKIKSAALNIEIILKQKLILSISYYKFLIGKTLRIKTLCADVQKKFTKGENPFYSSK
jgi:hypothetical protein